MAAGPAAVEAPTTETPLVVMAPVAAPVAAVAEPAGPVTTTLVFALPVQGHAINSRYGVRHLAGEPAPRRHEGIDIAAPTGTPVVASADGEIVRTGYEPAGYGRFIEVRHANGLHSFYGHLSRVDVKRGDRVLGGERIGRVGSTGYSTGPHLHFEVRRDGAKMNPERILGREYVVAAESAA